MRKVWLSANAMSERSPLAENETAKRTVGSVCSRSSQINPPLPSRSCPKSSVLTRGEALTLCGESLSLKDLQHRHHVQRECVSLVRKMGGQSARLGRQAEIHVNRGQGRASMCGYGLLDGGHAHVTVGFRPLTVGENGLCSV